MVTYRISFTFRYDDLTPVLKALLMTNCWQIHYGLTIGTDNKFAYVNTFYTTNDERDIPWSALGHLARDRFKESTGISPMHIPMWSYNVSRMADG